MNSPRWNIVWLCVAAIAVGCDRSGEQKPEVRLLPPPSEESAASSNPIVFADVTANSSVRAIYDNGERAKICSIAESLGGGVGVFDYDADGLPDLFFPGGGQFAVDQPLSGIAGSLWRNFGEMRYQAVAEPARADAAKYYTHGCAMADYDGDGFSDLLVTGYGGLHLFHNQGDGSFEEISADSGMVDDQWSTSAAWGDFNQDGNTDVFITHYVDWSWEKNPPCAAVGHEGCEICSPQEFNPLLDLVYFSNGDGTFRPAQEEAGITEAGKGLGVVAFDANGDSALDIYVANDTTKNFHFINDGKGHFSEAGVINGTAYDQRGVSNGSMGLAVLDYNNDQRPDIWVTNYENETFALYHNDNDGAFRCVTESTGVTSIGTLYVGFGTVAADFTCDGNEDLVVSNGHVMLYPTYSSLSQTPLYLKNSGRGKLTRVPFPTDSYFSLGHRGRGVVTSDLDGDHKLDLVFSHVNQPATILKNETQLSGSAIAFQLVGRACNRDAIGATVTLETSKQTMFRTIIGGGSYLSQGSYTVSFGMPEGSKALSAIVQWPDGTRQTLDSAEIQSQNLVVQVDRSNDQPQSGK